MNEDKKYIDGRGWKYKVMGGIGGDCFKAAYQKPGKSGSVGWNRSTSDIQKRRYKGRQGIHQEAGGKP